MRQYLLLWKINVLKFEANSRLLGLLTFSNIAAELVIQHYWKEIAGKMNTEQKEYKTAVAVIMRISNGNFRLIQRLFKQIKRVLKINDLKEITVEVVEATRDCLVIGEI